jgi:hypothetical protein
MEQVTLNFAVAQAGSTAHTALDHVMTQLGAGTLPTDPTGDVRLRRIVGDVRLRRVVGDAAPVTSAEQHTQTVPVQVDAKVHTWPGTVAAALVSNIMKTKHDTVKN